MGQERTHRKYSPSQSDRNFACEGSTDLLARVPVRPSGEYAEEGQKAHTILEAALNHRVRDARVAHEEYCLDLMFEDLDDGTNDFYLSVQTALDYVYGLLAENPDAVMWIEKYVDPPLPAAPGEAGGFCDIAVYLPTKRILYCIDYKHGVGVVKRAKGNKQAMQYAGGFLFEDDAVVDPSLIDTVVLVISQPRSFHPDGDLREYEMTPFEVWEYLDELNEKVASIESGEGVLTPGELQCQFCDARTLCPAREAMGLELAAPGVQTIQQFSQDQLPIPMSIDADRLGRIRFHAPAIRKWLSDVEKHCDELARSGHAVPGSKLVETQAKRSWYGDDKEVTHRLAALLGERQADKAAEELDRVMKRYPVLKRLYNIKLTALTTAEKLVVEEYKRRVGRGRKKKAAEDARQAFAFLTLKEKSGTLTLVDTDDPRPAINKSQNAFNQIAGLLPPPN